MGTVDFDWQQSVRSAKATFVYLQDKVSQVFENNQPTVVTQEDYTYYPANGFLQTATSQVVAGAEGQNVTTAYEYHNYGDWIWRRTRQRLVNAAGETLRETRFGYESGTGNLLSKEFVLDTGPNPVVQMRYDDYGNLKEFYDANANSPTVTEYDVSTRSYPVKITNALGHVVEYEYDDRFGKVLAQKDANGTWAYYDYDFFGRLTGVDYPDGGRQTVTYHDDVFPQYITTRVKEDAAGNTIDSYTFQDGLGRKIQTIHFGEAGTPIVTKIRYDEMGRAVQRFGSFFGDFIGYYADSQVPADAPASSTVYDLRGRPKSVEVPLGQDALPETTAVTTFSYSGLSTTITDPDGARKTETKDYLGRIVEVIEYGDLEQIRTTYGYNAAGDLLQVVDQDGHAIRIHYDSLGRKINMDDPDMGYWRYSYDGNGNLKTQIDAKGQVIAFVYDAINRIISKTYSTADEPVSYFYDEPSIANGIV
jgi:YD repeat-containing protein